MNLVQHIRRQPIMDEPYRRHLRSDAVFREVVEARESWMDTLRELDGAATREEVAKQRYQAAKAKAELMASMEGL